LRLRGAELAKDSLLKVSQRVGNGNGETTISRCAAIHPTGRTPMMVRAALGAPGGVPVVRLLARAQNDGHRSGASAERTGGSKILGEREGPSGGSKQRAERQALPLGIHATATVDQP
jgi:hypothetical protein